MGNSRTMLAVALAGALAGGLAIHALMRADAPVVDTESLDSDNGNLASTTMPAGAPSTAPPLQPQGAVAPSPYSTSPPDPVAMQAEALREAHLASRRLEARWAADREDPAVASRIEQRLVAAADSSALREVRYQPTRYQASCRSDLCRLEADFAPGADASEWTTRMLIVMGDTFGTASTVILPSGNGGYGAVVYAFKPGRTPGT